MFCIGFTKKCAKSLISWVGDKELAVFASQVNGNSASPVRDHLDVFNVVANDNKCELKKSRCVDIIAENPNAQFPPLCMEWLHEQTIGGKTGNFIALGLGKAIRIFNLEARGGEIDEDYSLNKKFLLGGTKYVERMTKNSYWGETGVVHEDVERKGCHKGPVLDLSFNVQRKLLASASADCVVKVWDITTSKPIVGLKHHGSEVNAVCWDPRGHDLLLSGSSMDNTVVMVDWRVDRKNRQRSIRWDTESGVKGLAWNPMVDHFFMVNLVNGEVLFFDARKNDLPFMRVADGDDHISAISYIPAKKDIFVTGSTTGMVKVWDQNCTTGSQPMSLLKQVEGGVSRLTFPTDNAKILAYRCSTNQFGIIQVES